MPRIETAGGFRLGKDIVGQAATADEQRIDAQVEARFLGNGVLGSKGVDEKLEIGSRFGSGFFEPDVESEKLDVADGNPPLQERKKVELGRQAGGLEHLFARTVVDQQIFHHNAVQQAEADAPHTETGVQKGFQLMGDEHRKLTLDIGNVQQQGDDDIEADEDTNHPTYCLLQSSDRPLIFIFSQQKYEIIHYPYYFYHYFCSA